MKTLGHITRLIFFFGSLILAGLAVLEKVMNFMGYTILRQYYSPWRLLEFAGIGLLFVIALQLRELRVSFDSRITKEELK
jgi:hypothetical protein